MKNKNILIILSALLLFFLFYWFQLRPAQIRKDCQQWAYDQGMDYFNYEPMKQVMDLVKKGQLQVEYMDSAYDRCIHSKGLMDE